MGPRQERRWGHTSKARATCPRARSRRACRSAQDFQPIPLTPHRRLFGRVYWIITPTPLLFNTVVKSLSRASSFKTMSSNAIFASRPVAVFDFTQQFAGADTSGKREILIGKLERARRGRRKQLVAASNAINASNACSYGQQKEARRFGNGLGWVHAGRRSVGRLIKVTNDNPEVDD
jgi:hypothetical protein